MAIPLEGAVTRFTTLLSFLRDLQATGLFSAKLDKGTWVKHVLRVFRNKKNKILQTLLYHEIIMYEAQQNYG